MLVANVSETALSTAEWGKDFMQLTPMVRDKGFVVLRTPDF